MTSPGSHILARDAESGANTNLSAGAIAGIACGAGALFLGAAALFVIYWRRQRQFDREDNSDGDSFDEARPPPGTAPAVSYTMDYKMDNPQHHEGDHGDQGSSSYTYSPEKPSYSFSPPLGTPGKAMPTHPAYIPRALVRGSTPSNRSTASSSPFPSPPFPSATSNPKTKPDDTVVHAYLAAAAAAQTTSSSHPPRPQTRDPLNHPRGSDSSCGLPIQPRPLHQTRQSPTQIPALVIPPSNDTTGPPQSQNPPGAGGASQPRKPRAYPPPRLNLNPNPLTEGNPPAPAPAPPPQLPPPMPNHTTRTGDKPLQGRENTTISGPLAFPEHFHHPGVPPGLPSQGFNTTNTNTHKSLWARAEPDPAAAESDDEYAFYDDPYPASQPPSHSHYHSHPHPQSQSQSQPQSDNRRTFRSRALTGGSGGGGSDDRDKDRERGENAKKSGRRRSDRNSGGGAAGGNRHYAEIEIGRGSDIW